MERGRRAHAAHQQSNCLNKVDYVELQSLPGHKTMIRSTQVTLQVYLFSSARYGGTTCDSRIRCPGQPPAGSQELTCVRSHPSSFDLCYTEPAETRRCPTSV